jgi:3-dehydroquinate dehydratase/shikimate dehydrogenase
VHDFSGVPKDLTSRVTAMRQTGAGVIKIAVPATRLQDCLPLLEIGRAGNAVVIAMGSAGIPSRLLATLFGSCWTYAGDGVAPGQIPAARMLDEFRFRAIGADTAVYGVVGNNVAHSLSPVMHNAAFEAGQMDAVYVPFPAADFEDFLAFADVVTIAGASVTIPFKRDALAAGGADEISHGVGAANTMRRSARGGWDVTNTDVAGFLDPLEAVFPKPLKGARAVIMGAGGAARAVAAALVSRGAQPTIHARRREQALDVASASGAASGVWPPPPGSWDLLINCTPLGGPTARRETPLPGGPFDGAMVYDLTYGEAESPLVREAREAGCLAIDGLPMLIAQAERQFEWWTGAPPKPGVMEAAARERIGRGPRRGGR